MKKSLCTLSIAAISCLAFLSPLTASAKAVSSHYSSNAKMLTVVKPSIVNINIVPTGPTSAQGPVDPRSAHPKPPQMTVGSGIIIDSKKGLIVTNAHVVRKNAMIVVTLQNGERFHAKLIGMDKSYDLAVLAVNNQHLTALPLANSDDLAVGSTVFAIGSPFGLQQTVTSGVVSAINRGQLNGHNFIQTDAPINMGNSGGALVNKNGKLVGINTAIITPNAGSIGIGFAIPSNVVKLAVKQLIENGKIESGVLGVIVQTPTTDLTNVLHLNHSKGALITDVLPGSPAQKAHLQPLDLVLHANGWVIDNANDLHNLMGLTAPGSSLHFTILRNNRSLNIKATAGNPKKLPAPKAVPFLSGMLLESSTTLEENSDRLHSGVQVSGIKTTSQAALAGLMAGDFIIEANKKRTPDLQTLVRIAKSSKDQLLIKLHRDGRSVYFVINRDT